MRKTLAERFWAKVNKRGPDECWLWLGAVDARGYGVIHAPGAHGVLKAHRVSLQLAGIDIPAGHEACHRCDVRLCVNDAHLFPGTRADNMRDAAAKGRLRGSGMRGETHYAAKLDAADVQVIRMLCGLGSTRRAIADWYGVSPAAISHISTGRNWRCESSTR